MAEQLYIQILEVFWVTVEFSLVYLHCYRLL